MRQNISTKLFTLAALALMLAACSENSESAVQAVQEASTTIAAESTTSAAPPAEAPTFVNEAEVLSAGYGIVRAGTYRVDTLGTPFSMEVPEGIEIAQQREGLLDLAEGASLVEADDFIDWSNTVRFVRVHQLSDPSMATSLAAFETPLDSNDLDAWLDGLDEGLLSGPATETSIGGREATVFEIDVNDAVTCDDVRSCVGIAANPFVDEHFLRQGFNHRIWWIDQDRGAPLLVVAQAAPDAATWLDDVERTLTTLAFGEIEDSPVPVEAPWEAGIRATTEGLVQIPAFGGLELDLPKQLTVDQHAVDSLAIYEPGGPPAIIEIIMPTQSMSGPIASVNDIALVLLANTENRELDPVDLAEGSARTFEISGGAPTEDPVLFTDAEEVWFPPNSATIWLLETDRGPLMISASSLFDPNFLGPITELGLEIGATMRLVS